MLSQNPEKSVTSSLPTFGDALLQVNFDDPKKKKDKEYGRKILAAIYKEQNNNSTLSVWGGRNIRWREVWQWLMGRQDPREFVDFVSVDGTKSYANIDMTPDRTGPQFVETLVNSMAQNDEYPCVTAIDDLSVKEKEDEKEDALYRMHSVEDIAQMSEASGLTLESPTAYVPDDELAAEVYFQLENRLPKEIKAEQRLEKVMADNEYEQLKRRLYRYLIGLNCGATKIERLDNGFIGIKDCVPANLIFNFFMRDSGKIELSYIGEIYSLKVRELRKKYGKSEKNPNGLTEKEVFTIAESAGRYNVANRFYYYWNDSFLYASDRPYDDYSVEVFDCEIKVFDTDYYVSKKDAYGRENIQPKKGIPTPTSEDAKVLATNKYTVYRGVWAVKADKMIYWGYPDVTIKPFMDISESLFSYTINIPNNDGDYVPSLFERGMEQLRLYTLLGLKIKQLVAAMAPAGVTLDIERARDIDLGGGNVIGWETVLKVRQQTGVVVWSSAGLDPNMRNERPPIEGIANAEQVTQLNELNLLRETAIAKLRQLWGTPLYRDGSDLPPRMGQGVIENQTANANNVTDFIKQAFKSLMQETLYKVCLIHWDDDVIRKGQTDLMNTVYQVQVEMKPSEYEKQLIENNIQVWSKTIDGDGNPLLSPKDVFRIRQIKNYKLQDLYLSSVVDTNRKKAEENKQRRAQETIQAQQESAAQANQMKQQEMQQKIQMEQEVEAEKAKNKKQEIVLERVLSIYEKSITTVKTEDGKEQKATIPPEILELGRMAFENVGLQFYQNTTTTEDEIEDEEIAEQQEEAAMQQQMMAEQEAAMTQQAAAEQGIPMQ